MIDFAGSLLVLNTVFARMIIISWTLCLCRKKRSSSLSRRLLLLLNHLNKDMFYQNITFYIYISIILSRYRSNITLIMVNVASIWALKVLKNRVDNIIMFSSYRHNIDASFASSWCNQEHLEKYKWSKIRVYFVFLSV